jgi:hypothetical protein
MSVLRIDVSPDSIPEDQHSRLGSFRSDVVRLLPTFLYWPFNEGHVPGMWPMWSKV